MSEKNKCHDCGAEEGQFHEPGCDMDECPFCHGQLLSCGCCYEKLGLNPNQEPVYSQGLTPEQEDAWDKILKEKGLIPYGQETRC
jgi:hypothetical protein